MTSQRGEQIVGILDIRILRCDTRKSCVQVLVGPLGLHDNRHKFKQTNKQTKTCLPIRRRCSDYAVTASSISSNFHVDFRGTTHVTSLPEQPRLVRLHLNKYSLHSVILYQKELTLMTTLSLPLLKAEIISQFFLSLSFSHFLHW